MKKILKIILFLLLFFGVIAFVFFLFQGKQFDVLQPQGTIGLQQKNLLIFTLLLGFAVIIPVFIMTIAIAWRYREGNKKASYKPNWDHNHFAETIWWGIPIVLIVILSVVTWTSSHQLDPYKPIASKNKPTTIQVVALDWKWLFIYPEQKIATVNFVQFPSNAPVNFEITSDAPMNSFWIPSLGGQIYAMQGMTTKLHLEASKNGNFNGSSANISGEGFAGMKFIAKASSKEDFKTWVQLVKQSSNHLNSDTYEKLAEKSKNNPPTYYSTIDSSLYDKIVMKYMMPEQYMKTMDHSGIKEKPATHNMKNMPGMHMGDTE